MFRLEIFYNEMLEKIKNIDILMQNQMIQKKEIKRKEKSYNIEEKSKD